MPGGHAGLRSTVPRLPQETTKSTTPRSSGALTIARRKHRRVEFCRIPPYYDDGKQADVPYAQPTRTVLGREAWTQTMRAFVRREPA